VNPTYDFTGKLRWSPVHGGRRSKWTRFARWREFDDGRKQL
jgi:hypothetical protein